MVTSHLFTNYPCHKLLKYISFNQLIDATVFR